jgi:hypothetical protein
MLFILENNLKFLIFDLEGDSTTWFIVYKRNIFFLVYGRSKENYNC